MKQLIALLLTLLCIAVLAGCVNMPAKTVDSKDETFSFHATVLEVNEAYLIVEPHAESIERKSTDKIQVALTDKTTWPIPQAGDTVNIVYNGDIMEIYPARLGKVFRVEIITTETDSPSFSD